MRAARLHAVGDLRVADEPEPVAGPGMSLVRVTAVGICGSDLHWFDEGAIGDARLTHPLVLGHEGAGVIAGALPGSPAASAGLTEGDTITSVGGQTVSSATDIQQILVKYHPGDKIAVSWQDASGQSHSTTVTLTSGPAA